jgi:putative hydroxymethylpyrimidine transport system substrate-binding protein
MTLPATPTRLVIGLDGSPGAVLGPLYVAGTAGDFTRAGLAVTLMPEASGSQSLAELSAGSLGMAVASEPDVLVGRARGEQLVAIATLAQGPLESVVSIPPHPVTAASGLTGKTVATDGTQLSAAELATILRAAGVEAGTVRTINTPVDLVKPLEAGTADASLGAESDATAVELDIRHHTPTLIKVEDAGVPTFNSEVLVVRMDEARDRGELLRSFLQALTQAAHAEQAAPASAVDALLATSPRLDRRFELASLKQILPALDPGAGNPFGYENPIAWRTFGDWMLANGLLGVHSNAGLAVDNEFLPGEGE